MSSSAFRVALFSGNYNYVRDGANKALNRLVASVLSQGHQVRIYSPTTDTPAFEPVGDLVSARSFALPFGRAEYRMGWPLGAETRSDLEAFKPDIIHVSSPDLLGQSAVKWARKRGLPVVASMHTRFDTYLRYYRMGLFEPLMRHIMRRFYNSADVALAPNLTTLQDMLKLDLGRDIRIWARGIESGIFTPKRRDMAWRQSLGIADNEVVIGFLGRLVLEKGLDSFADTLRLLSERQIPHRVLIVGDGPARERLREKLPSAIFVGFKSGEALGQAAASMDIFFNPSISEAFGNVMLEAMASGLPVVAARAPGGADLVKHGVTGQLLAPGDTNDFAEALQLYCQSTDLRHAHGKAGLSASASYDWETVNQAAIDVYQELVAAAQRGRP